MTQRTKTNPILIAAGVAVLLFSLVGAAAVTGMIPGSSASTVASTARG